MSEEDKRKDDPGTDPETQRQELIGRGDATHPAHERSRMLNTTRPGEEKREKSGRRRNPTPGPSPRGGRGG